MVSIFLFRVGLSLEEMTAKTSTSNCLTDPSDEKLYLHWDEMKWDIFGDVKEENVSVDELCTEIDPISTVLFPGTFEIF